MRARPVGTEVCLHLNKEFQLLGDPRRVLPILSRYCCLLPLPVHLLDPHGTLHADLEADSPGQPNSGPINAARPPWRDGQLDRDPASPVNRAFAARFERAFEPICVFPLPAGGVVEGFVWVQSGASLSTSDNRNVSVFATFVSHCVNFAVNIFVAFIGRIAVNIQIFCQSVKMFRFCFC